MNRRNIGTSGLSVNEIGYGSMSLGIQPERRPSEAEAIALVQRAVDELGVELIDTADSYCADENDFGYTERLLARALRGERRQRVVIATKGGFTRPDGRWMPKGDPAYLRSACERSLLALETDAIDLYQYHTVDRNVPIEESVGAIAELQREGKVRHIGVSNVSLEQLRRAMSVATIASVQNPLAPILYSPEKAEQLRFCREHGIAWIAYSPIGGHRNQKHIVDLDEWIAEVVPETAATTRQVMLAWLLNLAPNVIPIPATTRLEHLRENMQSATIRLTDEQVELLKRPRTWFDRHEEAKERGDRAGAIAQIEIGLRLHPGDATLLYNLACDLALDGQIESALAALDRSVDAGFAEAAHVETDEDLASLHGMPEFRRIVDRMAAATA